jgi:hypothetical protein
VLGGLEGSGLGGEAGEVDRAGLAHGQDGEVVKEVLLQRVADE